MIYLKRIGWHVTLKKWTLNLSLVVEWDCKWLTWGFVFLSVFPLNMIGCFSFWIFAVQLQHHARHRLPTFQLIFVHVIESLVFVPVRAHHVQLLIVYIFFYLYDLMTDESCMLGFADNDWYLIFSVWVLRWSAIGFHGLNPCLVVWTVHIDQVCVASFMHAALGWCDVYSSSGCIPSNCCWSHANKHFTLIKTAVCACILFYFNIQFSFVLTNGSLSCNGPCWPQAGYSWPMLDVLIPNDYDYLIVCDPWSVSTQ